MSEANRADEIHALPEASDRPLLAAYIANKTNCSVSQAKGILAAAGPERQCGDGGASKILGLAKRLRITGFAPANGN